MVRQLIEEAQRIPDAPPLPVDYEQLLTDLVRWIEECEAANGDVDTAIQVRGGGRWWHTAQGERLTEGAWACALVLRRKRRLCITYLPAV